MPHSMHGVGDTVAKKVKKVFHTRHMKSQSSDNQ